MRVYLFIHRCFYVRGYDVDISWAYGLAIESAFDVTSCIILRTIG